MVINQLVALCWLQNKQTNKQKNTHWKVKPIPNLLSSCNPRQKLSPTQLLSHFPTGVIRAIRRVKVRELMG